MIPGTSAIAKYLGGIDSTYNSLFMDSQWRDMFEKQDSPKLGESSTNISMIITLVVRELLLQFLCEICCAYSDYSGVLPSFFFLFLFL